MNQFNAINGDELTETPIEWNIQPPELYFNSQNCPPKTNPVVLAIMGVLDHHFIDNGDVEVFPS